MAERAGSVLGYAYANHFRPRKAYRFCLEDSVYLAEAAKGQGVGTLLLAELMARCEALGARQMLAGRSFNCPAGARWTKRTDRPCALPRVSRFPGRLRLG